MVKKTIDTKYSPEQKMAIIDYYKGKPKTFVSPDFAEKTPCISELIAQSQGNIRIARGSEDDDTGMEDINVTADVHRREQPNYLTEIREVTGLKHSVLKDEVSSEKSEEYFHCLFDPISGT